MASENIKVDSGSNGNASGNDSANASGNGSANADSVCETGKNNNVMWIILMAIFAALCGMCSLAFFVCYLSKK